MTDLLEELVERIRKSGPLRFDEYVEAALYDPDRGFFATGSGAGRAGGDFLTSPEVGPLFGALFARYLDRLWNEADRPGSFAVVEVAAGRGALAIAVRAANPECGAALTYQLVERSAELRARQRDHLPISAADPRSADQVATDPQSTDLAAPGPRFLSHNEMDQVDGPVDLVFANELLDNIPIRILERTEDGWGELYVGVDPSEPGTLCELLVPLDPAPTPADIEPDRAARALIDWADLVGPDAAVGARIPVQEQAAEWLTRALAMVRKPGGEVIVIDYCRNTAELAKLDCREWLRTYREHERGGPPLSQPGSQDITCDVAPDQLALAARSVAIQGSSNFSQAEWLADLGVADLVEEGQRIWNESAGAPDLAAIRARSRISEAQALTDQAGLGGFRVLGWKL